MYRILIVSCLKQFDLQPLHAVAALVVVESKPPRLVPINFMLRDAFFAMCNRADSCSNHALVRSTDRILLRPLTRMSLFVSNRPHALIAPQIAPY